MDESARETLGTAFNFIVLAPGPAYWLITMFELGHFWLFVVGMIPFCWPFTGLIGIYSFFCGWPAWLHAIH